MAIACKKLAQPLTLWCYLVLLCCMCGCGYRVAGGDPSMSSVNGKSIAVSMFGNTTHRPDIETVLTGSLREEIAWRSGAKQVAEADNSELVIAGIVSAYSSTPVSYTADDRIREYRAAITVEATLRERATGAVLWKGSRTLFQDYPAIEFPVNNRQLSDRIAPQNRIALQQNGEDAAVRQICRKLAQDLLENINARF